MSAALCRDLRNPYGSGAARQLRAVTQTAPASTAIPPRRRPTSSFPLVSVTGSKLSTRPSWSPPRSDRHRRRARRVPVDRHDTGNRLRRRSIRCSVAVPISFVGQHCEAACASTQIPFRRATICTGRPGSLPPALKRLARGTEIVTEPTTRRLRTSMRLTVDAPTEPTGSADRLLIAGRAPTFARPRITWLRESRSPRVQPRSKPGGYGSSVTQTLPGVTSHSGPSRPPPKTLRPTSTRDLV